MKLGYVSAIFPELKLNQLMEIAAGEGFGCIEVMCWPVGRAERKYAGVTHIDVTQFTKAQAEDVRAQVDRYRVGISALGYYPNILSSDRAQSRFFISHLKNVIRAAQLLGLPGINTFIGADPARNIEANFVAFMKVWPDIVRFAEDHDVRIGIEPCPMLYSWDEWPGGKNMAYSPTIWRRVFRAIPSKSFGLNYDPSHFVWQFMDYLAPLAEFRTKLFHVHAKDTKIDRAKLDDSGVLALGWHSPRIPGYGDVKWDQFFSTLREVGYDGPVCIEVEDESFGTSLAGRTRALRTARNMIAQHFTDSTQL